MPVAGKRKRHIQPLAASVGLRLLHSMAGGQAFGFGFDDAQGDGLVAAADFHPQGVINAALTSASGLAVDDACRQVSVGRRLGSPLNTKDITSTYCHRRKGAFVKRLDRYDVRDGEWQEIVVEDRKATPADIAATRIDFGDWLCTLPRRQRRIAEKLALGETTSRTARMFRISAGRVSQIRRELYDAWHEFHGEPRSDCDLATA